MASDETRLTTCGGDVGLIVSFILLLLVKNVPADKRSELRRHTTHGVLDVSYIFSDIPRICCACSSVEQMILRRFLQHARYSTM
jgi:hypothetical protein